MASDAQINQIEVLSSFAASLVNFSESITSNSNSFVVLITEKLSELRVMEKKANEICRQVEEQRKQISNAYASIAGTDDNSMRNRLSVQLQDAEQKEREAKRLYSVIRQNVLVTHGAVTAMIDNTKQFGKETSNNVEKGIAFVKRSQLSLEQYNENQKKV